MLRSMTVLATRSGAALVATLVLCLLPAGAPAIASPAVSAAAPAPIEVLVSADGVSFTPGLRGALISSGDALVPGGSVGADLWVRNPAPMPAALRVSARDLTPTSPEFAEAVAVTAGEDSGADGPPLTLAEMSSCQVLLEPRELQPGETTRLHLRFTMADLTGRSGQGESAAMTLVVAMRDAEAGTFPEAGCGTGSIPGGQSGSTGGTGAAGDSPATTGDTAPFPAPAASSGRPALAYTGSTGALGVLLTAAILVGAGAALLAARRGRSSVGG